MRARSHYLLRTVVIGTLFGAAFPALATAITMMRHNVSAFTAQKMEPLLWIVDSAPLVLGVFSYFIGKFLDRLDRLARALKADAARDRTTAIESARLALLGEMAAGIAHEINNPLQVITLGTSRMHDLIKSGASAEQLSKQVARIDLVADKMAQIIRGLKNLARSDESSPFVAVSLTQLLGDAVLLCSAKFKHANVRIETPDFSKSPEIYISCRPSQIAQCIVNLLSNAIDAVEARGTDAWVKLSLEGNGETASVSVTDSGSGISNDIAEKIFSPFFTTKPSGKGTGLGLSISRELITAHQGSLTIDHNSPNTRFVITLPTLRLGTQPTNEASGNQQVA